ncbi:MAG: HAD-IA family hydrolase [Candidatus Saccharimonadales bacterium]
MKSKSQKPVIIFDFDGTIGDSFSVISKIFYDLTDCRQEFSQAEINHFKTMKPSEVGRIVGIKWWQVPRLLARGRRLMSQRINLVPVFTGMPEVIKRLHKNGYQLFIISTNSAHNVDLFLMEHKLKKYFVSVKGGSGIGGKRRAIIKLLNRHNWAPLDCVYIGDEPRDMLAAQSAGLKAIAVAWGFSNQSALAKTRPSGIARHPNDIIELVQSG